MSILNGQNVLLGVSASIAAYKSAELVRCFVKLGANVQVIQTPTSKDFVTPLTLSTLSKKPVLSTLTKEEDKDLHHYHSGIAKRSFNLGWKIARRFDLTKIEGSMKDGLLKLFIPLTPESKPKTVSIK